ncbi:MAG: trypsin-like peptidase domain-containing protein [Sedimenticolaceae bacterium]
MNMQSSKQRRLTTLAAGVALALASGLAAALPYSATESRSAASSAVQQLYGPASFSSLVDRVKPSVVNISTKGKAVNMLKSPGGGMSRPELPEGSPFGEMFRRFFDQAPDFGGPADSQREYSAAGSGFIISADGYVVTSNHVIEHADEIEVVLDDGTRHPASVRGRDSKTDLAVLKIDVDKALPYVELGSSEDPKVGEWVVAVGNPFGLGGTVTAGIISARGHDIQSGPYDSYLQIDAPINRGNSGGPLFDARGQVIGINTAIYSPTGGSVGIGFAVPSSIANDVITQLLADGRVERGWLGVQIQPVTEEVAESFGLPDQHGALVASVVPGSPPGRGGRHARG